MSNETEHAKDCPACRSVDATDGTVDGKLAHHYSLKVANENTAINALRNAQDKAADEITAFAGSLKFVYIHSVWFGIWIVINLGIFGSALIFDEYPFGLLTMIVSLEAIFLSTFVMVSQNRQAERAELRAQLDFETNLRSEIWAVHVGQALGLDLDHVEKMVQEAIESTKQDKKS